MTYVAGPPARPVRRRPCSARRRLFADHNVVDTASLARSVAVVREVCVFNASLIWASAA
jgi:hypothetical protein